MPSSAMLPHPQSTLGPDAARARSTGTQLPGSLVRCNLCLYVSGSPGWHRWHLKRIHPGVDQDGAARAGEKSYAESWARYRAARGRERG